jgi:hypothetical protein
LCTDVPNGLKHFIRTPMANSMDGDFDTGNVRYKARERYSFGFSDPLGMFASPGGVRSTGEGALCPLSFWCILQFRSRNFYSYRLT